MRPAHLEDLFEPISKLDSHSVRRFVLTLVHLARDNFCGHRGKYRLPFAAIVELRQCPQDLTLGGEAGGRVVRQTKEDPAVRGPLS